MNRDLARTCTKQLALGADPVAEIEEVEALEVLIPQDILSKVDLNLTRAVFHVGERALAVRPIAHDAAGHGDLGTVPLLRQAFRRLILFETRYGVPSEMGPVVRIGVRLHATILESL